MPAQLQTAQADSLATSIPFLAELSPQDVIWDSRKASADKVSQLYRVAGAGRLADRIHFCADFLAFQLTVEGNLKLRNSQFCRARHCPVCQWRRCLMWKARVHTGLPKVLQLYPDHRWIFLTLTVKNCPVQDLRETVLWMNKSWERMTKRKIFPAKGWVKTLEVTRSTNAEAHPHFHSLLLVNPSYFAGRSYVSHANWVKLWRECLRVDYDPSVRVNAIKSNNPAALIPEVIKYQTKVSDLVADADWLLELSEQMHKIRCISTGGTLAEHFKELERDPQDLIGKSDNPEQAASEALLYFGWKREIDRYKMED